MVCNTPEWCAGGDECKAGHKGLGCSECMKNWFFYAGSCYECEKNARYYSLVCLGVMLFFLAIVMVVFADKVDKFRKYAMGTKKKLKKM